MALGDDQQSFEGYVATCSDAADADVVSQIARQAFDGRRDHLTPAYFRWLYEVCYRDHARLVTLRFGPEQVGHAAVLRQSVRSALPEGPDIVGIAQLTNLFVLPAHRSMKAIRAIYRALDEEIGSGGYGAVLTMPNARATLLNQRFLKLKSIGRLDTRAGLVMPKVGAPISGNVWSRSVADDRGFCWPRSAPSTVSRDGQGRRDRLDADRPPGAPARGTQPHCAPWKRERCPRDLAPTGCGALRSPSFGASFRAVKPFRRKTSASC